MIKQIILGLSIFVSLSVLASGDCTKKSMTQEIDACYATQKNVSEKRLNDEYVALKKRVAVNYSTDKEMARLYSSKLLSAQRNWLKYRDEQCSMESLFADAGTPANITLTNKCVSRLDEQRVSEMQNLPY